MGKIIDIEKAKKDAIADQCEYDPHWKEKALGQIDLLGLLTSVLMSEYEDSGHPELRKLTQQLMRIITDMMEVKIKLMKPPITT